MGIFSKFEGKMEDTFEGGNMGKAPISPVQIMKKAEKQMRREKMVSAGKQYAPTLYTVLVNADDDQRLFGFYPTLAGECETRLSATASKEGLFLDCQPLVRFIVDDGLKHGKFDVIAEVVSASIIDQLRAEEMQRYGMGGASASPAQAASPQRASGANRGYNQQQAYGQVNQAGYGASPQVNAYGAYAQPAAQQAYGAGAGGFAPAPVYAAPGQNAYSPQASSYPSQDAAQGAYLVQQGSNAAFPAYTNQGGKPPLPYVPEEEIDRSVNYGEYTFNSENFTDYHASEESSETPSSNSEQKSQGMFSDEEPLPGQPLNIQAPSFQESSFEEDARSESPAAPDAVQPHRAQAQDATPEQANQYGKPFQAQQPNAYPVQAGAAAVQGAAAYGMGAMAGAYQGGQYGVPPTVAFTAGAAQANPIPNQAAVRAHLTDTTSNRSYDLATNRVLIGRETGNDIVVSDLNASRQHAQIEFEAQGIWVITDLGSTNGTLVNGQPVQRRGLQNGDRITIGVTEFVFSQY